MVRMILFWVASVLFIAACDDFELPKMGGLGEPCFKSGLCEGGLVCVEGTCVAATGDVDVFPEADVPFSDEDLLVGDGEEEETDDAAMTDGEEPESDFPDEIADDGTLPSDFDMIDADMTDTDTPDTDVTLPLCGNGVIEGDEECDDNNTADGDGCSHVCTIEPPDAIIDLVALYSGQKDKVLLQWTAPGPQGYCYDVYRVCVDSDCVDLSKTGDPGTIVTYYADVLWYSGTHEVTVQPMRSSGASGSVASIQVNTNAQVDIQPTVVAFGTIGYNSVKGETVTITNISPLVDLEINEINLPMNCGGKVSIVSGGAAPGDFVKLVPGATREVLLRYAPTEISSCVSGDRLFIQWITHGNPYYESLEIPISGNSVNTPPVITKIEFSKNPLKASEGSTRMRVYVRDENFVFLTLTDGIIGVGDFRDINGDPRELLTNWTGTADDHEWFWWRDINVASFGDGIYVIPITVTDAGGNVATANATFAVYSGSILEVGSGKLYSSLGAALPNYNEGDIVVVYPGTYAGTANTTISGNGTDLLVYGIAGPEETIIDLSLTPNNVAFDMSGGESASVIGGFTVRGGSNRAALVIGQPNPETFLLTNCSFENNGSNAHGGAIFVSGNAAQLTVRHSRFIENSVPSPYYGGAIYAQNGAKVALFDVSFVENDAQMGGAIAISTDMVDIQIEKSVFWGNRSSVGGGALHAFVNEGGIDIINSIFASNWSGGHGGALFFDGSSGVTTASFSIYNSTIVENECASEGGGIIVTAAGTFILKDSIVFFNQAGDNLVSQLKIFDDGSGSPEVATATVSFCTIGGAPNPISDNGNRINAPYGFVPGSNGNLNSDPLFLGTGSGVLKYRLVAASPCVDASSDGSTVPQYDFFGYSRQDISGKGDGSGTEADMGALEYIP